MADKFLHVHDSDLGYVPRAGVSGYVRDGGAITIEANGFRYTGETPASSDAPLLALGNSFTYGEDVGDLDAWPAQLQRLIGRTVLNGGVSGYGLDQIVLRAERLTVVHRPAAVIVGLIADDIRRTEMRRMWWQNKPWFTIEDGHLVLKGVPVPDRAKLPLEMRWRIERLLIQFPPAFQYLTGIPSGSIATVPAPRFPGGSCQMPPRYQPQCISARTMKPVGLRIKMSLASSMPVRPAASMAAGKSSSA